MKSDGRQFLTGTGVATTGASLPLAAVQTSASTQPLSSINVDFCVVGAGYAGLTAALRIQQAGRSAAVLEARDRVGGRIWSAPLFDGTAFDIGGHWVGPTQRRIQALAEEIKVPIFESYTKGSVV